MRTKDAAKQVIDSLPDDATMDDVIHALYINVKFHAVRRDSPGQRSVTRGGEEEAGKMAQVIWGHLPLTILPRLLSS